MRWLLLLLALTPIARAQFAPVEGPRVWSFPRDHAAHPRFATEWWYFTGSLLDTGQRRFGYELTFFRVALTSELSPHASPWRGRDVVLAHLAVTDVAGERFRSAERSRRLVDGIAEADTLRLRLAVGDWRAREDDGAFELHAGDASLGLRLRLMPARPPMLHGDGGYSRKDEAGRNASYYYSIPRLSSSGSLLLEGDQFVVQGDSWMDHEFFSGETPADGLGWDWFSIHFDDASNLMLYRVRPAEGVPYVFGSWMGADGTQRNLAVEGASFRELAHWQSADSGNRYPTAWEVELPREALTLRTRALLPAQEIDARRSVGFAYWEGLSEIEAEWAGRSLRGSGYVELTGYGAAESR